jgi:hypothetical protein
MRPGPERAELAAHTAPLCEHEALWNSQKHTGAIEQRRYDITLYRETQDRRVVEFLRNCRQPDFLAKVQQLS